MKTTAMKIFGSLALSTLALSGVAQATDNRLETTQVIVRYGDLDLSSNQGVHQLYSRLARAATTACSMRDSYLPERHLMFMECKRTALEDAVTQVASQALTSLHGEHSVRTAGSH